MTHPSDAEVEAAIAALDNALWELHSPEAHLTNPLSHYDKAAEAARAKLRSLFRQQPAPSPNVIGHLKVEAVLMRDSVPRHLRIENVHRGVLRDCGDAYGESLTITVTDPQQPAPDLLAAAKDVVRNSRKGRGSMAVPPCEVDQDYIGALRAAVERARTESP